MLREKLNYYHHFMVQINYVNDILVLYLIMLALQKTSARLIYITKEFTHRLKKYVVSGHCFTYYIFPLAMT